MYGNGKNNSAIMVAAKGRMAEAIKRMMAPKIKALVKSPAPELEEEEEEKPGLSPMAAMGQEEEEGEGEGEEGESDELEIPPEELAKLVELYSKLKR